MLKSTKVIMHIHKGKSNFIHFKKQLLSMLLSNCKFKCAVVFVIYESDLHTIFRDLSPPIPSPSIIIWLDNSPILAIYHWDT